MARAIDSLCVVALTTSAGNSTLVNSLLTELEPLGLRERVVVMQNPLSLDPIEGCFKAHQRAWRHADDQGCNHMLVLEDDAFFDVRTRDSAFISVEDFLNRGMPFDLLYLGYSVDYPFADPHGPLLLEAVDAGNVLRVDGALFTHAYVINRMTAASWAESMTFKQDTHLDVAILAQYARTYAVYPMTAYQRLHTSTIFRYGLDGDVKLFASVKWLAQHAEAVLLGYTPFLPIVQRMALIDQKMRSGLLAAALRTLVGVWATLTCILLLVWRASPVVVNVALLLAATWRSSRRVKMRVLACAALLHLLAGPRALKEASAAESVPGVTPPTVVIGDDETVRRVRSLGLRSAKKQLPVLAMEGKSVGVWRAHQAALRLAQQDGGGALLVLESDVTFYEGWAAEIPKALAAIATGECDLVNFGGLRAYRGRRVSPGVVRGRGVCTEMILYAEHAARRILEQQPNATSLAIDDWQGRHLRTCFLAMPAARQKNGAIADATEGWTPSELVYTFIRSVFDFSEYQLVLITLDAYAYPLWGHGAWQDMWEWALP